MIHTSRWLTACGAVLLVWAHNVPAREPGSAPADTHCTYLPVTAAVIPPVSVGRFFPNPVGNVSFNLFAGKLYALRGVEVGVFVNTEVQSVRGMQAAGIGNIVGGDVRGVHSAGIVNVVGSSVSGVQGAGIINVAGDDVFGAQTAGLVNVGGGDVSGAQGALIINIAGGKIHGLQGAAVGCIAGAGVQGSQTGGVFAITGSHVEGVQGSYVISIAGQSVTGCQVSGIMCIGGSNVVGLQAGGIGSISGGTVEGIQGAGVFAVAREVRGVQAALFTASDSVYGVQAGFINRSRRPDGYPIGFLNLVDGVPVRVAFMADESRGTSIELKTGSRHTHGVISLGGRVFSEPQTQAIGLGIGAHFGENRYTADLDAITYGLLAADSSGEGTVSTVRLVLGMPLVRRVSLHAGMRMSVFCSDKATGAVYAPWSVYKGTHGRYNIRVWPGVTAGISVAI